VTVYQIRFEGPSTLAVSIARELADADGVELISEELTVEQGVVTLVVDVEATSDAVTDAVAQVRGGLPREASIAIVDR
jgi:hypothetical protein